MAKLYVFGIGGTGSRVIKSFIFLLSSGVKLGNNIKTVVPIIIDPDGSNGDYTRTVELLKSYRELNKATTRVDGMFSTPIRTLTELTQDANIEDSFKMLNTISTQNDLFRGFIQYDNLPKPSKDLMDLLYSNINLNADMTVGFKGNPNIGSVVLNQFKNSPEYQIFLNGFSKGDSIFIISSIFGGTGAAGFPLLLRNLREVDNDFPGLNEVANSKIGALSMMPYFKINPPQDEGASIDSSSFMGKAQAALQFYTPSIFNAKQLNAFYSIGEDANNYYAHNDGAAEQKNRAHFLELASALAIVDFTQQLGQMKVEDRKALDTFFKEFGIEESTSRKITFKGLGESTRDLIIRPLIKLYLLVQANRLRDTESSKFDLSPWNIRLKNAYRSDGFYSMYLRKFENHFSEWLSEMSESDVSFAPFNRNLSYNNLLNLVADYPAHRSGLFSNSASCKILDKELNRSTKTTPKTGNTGSDYINIFNDATSKVVSRILK